MNTIIDKFLDTIGRYDLISKGDKIVIGVSGGPDSMALLSLLMEAREAMKLSIQVVHLNHMNRGELSFEDMEYVREFCRERDIPCKIVVSDIVSKAKEEGRSFEEVGREARYDLFEEVRRELDFTKIAVAHNQNDQAETILFRLIRGAGIDGLKSMSPKRDLIIRPLIEITRSEIESYCEEMKLSPRFDETNDELLHDRNIIRNILLPAIEKDLNPSVVSTLSNSAKLIAFDADYLLEHSKKELMRVFRAEMPLDLMSGEELETDLHDFNELHFSVRSRIIRLIVECLTGSIRDVSSKAISETLRVISESKHSTETTIGNAKFRNSYTKLIVTRCDECDTETPLPKLYSLNVDVMDRADFRSDCRERCRTVYIDYDKVEGELFIRKRKDGDKFKPFGMKGTKKLKRFMIDEKIPVADRERIPLVCDGEEIVWVYGYRMNEDYRVTSETRRIARLTLTKVGK